MLALRLMLLPSDYAHNYAGIIDSSLLSIHPQFLASKFYSVASALNLHKAKALSSGIMEFISKSCENYDFPNVHVASLLIALNNEITIDLFQTYLQ